MQLNIKKANKNKWLSKFIDYFLFLSIFSAVAYHSNAAAVNSGFIDSQSLSEVSSLEIAKALQPGDFLVIGEVHGQKGSQDGQMQILKELRRMGKKVRVGFEFVAYTDQLKIVDYRSANISEEDFLNSVGWGKGFSFDFYREQMLFPQGGGEGAYALNCPRELTQKISKYGLSSLTPDQYQILPPGLMRGNANYFERFKAAIGSHLPNPSAVENYFWAQSVWDDTMAWQSIENHSNEDIFVIIVGEFHVQYGGGLPDRLKERLRLGNISGRVFTISQISKDGLNEEELMTELLPSVEYGVRADYFWIFE